MPRLLLRMPGLRPLTRLGGFASRPLLPVVAAFPNAFRSPHTSPSRSRSPALEQNRNYTSSSPRNSDDSRSSSPAPSEKLPENATLTERLKYMMKKYGWYALGVYIFFSSLDFALTFAAINYFGAEYASHVMEVIKSHLPAIFTPAASPEQPTSETTAPGREGLYAILVLTYTIHKTLFLPFRVGLTAAFTPRLVKWLGKKGYAGSEGTKRAMVDARQRLRRSSSSSSSSSRDA